MNIIPKSFDIHKNNQIEQLITLFREQEDKLELINSSVFLEYPLYKDDDDSVVMTQILLLSPKHGVVIIYSTELPRAEQHSLNQEINKLDKIAGHITSKLFKNDKLRSGLMGLSIPVHAVLFAKNIDDISRLESKYILLNSNADLITLLNTNKTDVSDTLIKETLSSLQGAKGLLRPTERHVERYEDNTKVAKIHQVESKILQFDNEQQDGYIPAIDGPHRIRGLAGSGKTVILTMKVVQTLLRENNRNISVLYTFSTRSLYQHVKRLIHRFFREFHDDMSFLDCVNTLHAWGGASNPGVYYNACIAHGVTPLTFKSAQYNAPSGTDPFEYACQKLLEAVEIKPQYDYVFVDEAQDYGRSYLLLCTKLAKENRVTLGADVFQNIFQPKALSAKDIFGADSSLEFKQDDFLETCYRTPLSVLVAAHSIGLGIYGQKQVQKIESVELWKNLGYEVTTRDEGFFDANEEIVVTRAESKSPTLSQEAPVDLIKYQDSFRSISSEVEYIANKIILDINNEGLLPEDILVICIDDRHCNTYFNQLNIYLEEHSIYTNNIHSNKFSISDFHVSGRVTLSTIHKAKGNEAYSVYIMGCDSVSHNLNLRNRNLLFTAMTRTKGWISLTGCGDVSVFNEIEAAILNTPNISFTYPSLDEVERIEGDLKRKTALSTESELKLLQKVAHRFGGMEDLERLMAEAKAIKEKNI
ncbi:hypothetical protein GNP61_05290 [Aliivibrio fischeri]|uniref:DEAD/DEAH box helicase n=1 Tax=Aliivibrio fischeri TaxID=668 RepID=UPI0012DAC5B3|nr:ATP-binding domain-containing protein [Aliivibrio fischeri]MUK40970.1 hypothetical protein [Aliivibrio fischeri]